MSVDGCGAMATLRIRRWLRKSDPKLKRSVIRALLELLISADLSR
jgi:hypothetical protein